MNTEDTRLADQTPSLSAQTLKVCLVDGAALDTPLLRTALLDAFTPFRPDISTASCADLEQVGCADVNLLYWTPAFGTADISAWTSTDVPLVALFQPMPDVPRADTTKLAIDAGACATVTLPVNRAELRRAASKVLTLVTPKADGPVAKVESGRQGLAADAPAPITPLERKILGDMIAGSAAVKPNALPSPLLIVGENGTGKALAARAVHMDSVGATHPFVTVNCGSLSGTMGLETLGLLLPQDTLGPQETLGMNAPDSAISRARGGTLFLDEVFELEPRLRAAFGNLAETCRREGVHLICSTSQPEPDDLIGDAATDWLWPAGIILKPLRERTDEIADIAAAFMESFCGDEGRAFEGVEPEVTKMLRAYPWPGNVRELENCIRRAVIIHDGHKLTRTMLPPEMLLAGNTEEAPDFHLDAQATDLAPQLHNAVAPGIAPFWVQEQRIIEDALAACDGHVGRAAAALEIAPSTIYRKMASWQALGR